MLLEVLTVSQLEVHILPGIFVSQTSLRTKLAVFTFVFCIAGKNVVHVVVLHTQQLIVLIVAAVFTVVTRITAVVTSREFQSCIQRVLLRQRCGKVGLEDMLA